MKDKFYTNIPGWLSDKEAVGLYNLCLNFSGSILEIGSMYGKSTSVICEAIRDSSSTAVVDSCDINFKNREEFIDFYTKVHGGITVPDLVEEYSFSKNKNIFEVAKEYLGKYDLLKYVTLIPENFHTFSFKYDLIFCDALHDINEIKLNLPYMKKISNNNCIWVVHDFNCTYKLFPTKVNDRKLNFINAIDTLGVFRI
jgi:hypothetical protein